MRPMKYIFLLLIPFLLMAIGLPAQQAHTALDIQLNKNILQPGDSLLIKIHYPQHSTTTDRQVINTLQLIVENEQGQRTRLRWPMRNGEASGALYLPDSLPQGRYNLLAGLQERFFEVVGELRNAKNIRTIRAMLLTKDGHWDEQEIPVTSNNTFTIRNWLFEDNALLAFSGMNDKQVPDIRISTQLDSVSTTLAVAVRSFYVGTPPAAEPPLDKLPETTTTVFSDRGMLLPGVLLRTTIKTPAQQFNDEYASGLFKGGNERIIPVMDDPAATGYPNILAYLQGRVAGLQITGVGFQGGDAMWRGGPVSFFVDELRMSVQQLAVIPMADIAIVKAFPPPFFGAPGGGSGGIAVYTRRGGEGSYLPPNRKVFRVRGYTPAAVVLDMDKMLL